MTSGDIEFVRGDNARFRITLLDDNDDPYILTGCTMILYAKYRRTHSVILIQRSCTWTDPTLGIAYVDFVPTDTLNRTDGSDLEVGYLYAYDIELTMPSGERYTILRANFKVLQD